MATDMEPKEAAETKEEAKKPAKSLGRSAAMLALKIAIVAAVVAILVTVVGGIFICHTSDMYPSLRDGDLVITFRLGKYKSGDIVAYGYEGKTYFGRIVGEPGDEIFIDKDGTFTVNDIAPYENIFYETIERDSDTVDYPYTVVDGEYFILADAREQAVDSRTFGPIKKLKGKVVLMIRRRGF